MKQIFKRLTAVFVAAALAVTCLPLTAIAETLPQGEILATGDTGTYQDFEYEELEDGTLSITGYSGSDAKITIPSEINGKKVTVIGDNAFFYCTSLTKITIPYNVETIGSYAFIGCSSLTEINLPDNVKTIGSYVFIGCSSLTEINLPDSLTTIEVGTFSSCSSLMTVNLPDSVTTIGSWAFSSCSSLTKINLPASVTTIGNEAFSSCSSLTEINVKEKNKNFCSIDGVLFSKDKTTLICFPCSKAGTSYTVPDGVTTIGDKSFNLCSLLKKINLPDSVTTIGDSAFSECLSLTEINLSDSLTTIGVGAFSECSSLTEINLPDSLTTIGVDAFSRCSSLTEINVEEKNKNFCSIDGVLFSKDMTTLICFPCSKAGTSYTVPDGVTTIGEEAFWGCSSLTEITIPESVTTMGNWAFSDCYSLTEINLPDGLTTIEECTFYSCSSLMTVNLPDSVTTIGENAFYECSSLTKINIPDRVTTIGGWAFSDCYSLTKITIPDSVTTIGDFAFQNCYSLAEITVSKNLATIGYGAFIWCKLLTKMTVPASVTEIGDWAFDGCSDNFTIYGYTNSYAETYSKENEIPFVSVGLFLNSESDVSVAADKGVIPADTQLGVKQTAKTDISVSYNITLTQNGKEVQPEGKVTIRIPIPEDWGNWKMHAYRKNANGDLTDMNGIIAGGYIFFTTDRLGEYTVKASFQDMGEITLYGLDSYYEEDLSIPEDMLTSYRLEFKGETIESCLLISGESVEISDDLVITPSYTTRYWIGNIDSTSGAEGEVVFIELNEGVSELLINTDKNSYKLTVNVEHYSTYYADNIIREYLADNITDDMDITEKLDVVARFPASFDYSPYQSGYVGMIIKKGGDCWASTSLIIRELEMLGIEAWARNGNRDSGAGSGHMNAMAVYDGVYYELEAGYNGTAPRYYYVRQRDSLFNFRSTSDGLVIYQYDGREKDGTTLKVPAEKNGKKVIGLEKSAFSGLDFMQEVVLPEGLEYIESYAFYYMTALKKINIPSTVERIDGGAFLSCDSLEEIDISPSNENFTLSDRTLYSKDMTRLYYVMPDVTDISIPDGVQVIEPEAFRYNDNCVDVVIPDSVTKIGDAAFHYCTNLRSLSIGRNVREIGQYCFINTIRLKEVFIPRSVETIGEYAFGFYATGRPIENFTIYGYAGSAAETYANENNINFIAVNDFVDNATGITITAGEDSVPSDAKLTVTQTEKTADSVSYKVSLTQNGKEIQPKKNITIYIPVPEDQKGQQIYVYNINANIISSNMHAEISGADARFSANQTGEFMITAKKRTVAGDVNGDGDVGELDSVELARYLANWNVTIDKNAADLDGNGSVTELDSVILARRLAGWNV